MELAIYAVLWLRASNNILKILYLFRKAQDSDMSMHLLTPSHSGC